MALYDFRAVKAGKTIFGKIRGKSDAEAWSKLSRRRLQIAYIMRV